MNPYDKLRRPDFQAQQGVPMPWLESPPMMPPPEDEGIGQNTEIMASALKQRMMGSNPPAPKTNLPMPDINVAEPPIPAPNITAVGDVKPELGSKFAGGMKSL